MYRFTSAIPKAHGSAVRTKTPTGCCGNTCRRRRICPATLSRNWTRSPCASINGHEKHWDLKLRRLNCKPVLHRPLETTGFINSYPIFRRESTEDNFRVADDSPRTDAFEKQSAKGHAPSRS